MSVNYSELLYFDKIYSNYAAACDAISSEKIQDGMTKSPKIVFGDDVYPGRFILIDYRYQADTETFSENESKIENNFNIDKAKFGDGCPSTYDAYGYHLVVCIKSYNASDELCYEIIGSLYVENPKFKIEEVSPDMADGIVNQTVEYDSANKKWIIKIAKNPTFAVSFKDAEKNSSGTYDELQQPSISYNTGLGKWLLQFAKLPEVFLQYVKIYKDDINSNEEIDENRFSYDEKNYRWILNIPEVGSSLDFGIYARVDGVTTNENEIYYYRETEFEEVNLTEEPLDWNVGDYYTTADLSSKIKIGTKWSQGTYYKIKENNFIKSNPNKYSDTNCYIELVTLWGIYNLYNSSHDLDETKIETSEKIIDMSHSIDALSKFVYE